MPHKKCITSECTISQNKRWQLNALTSIKWRDVLILKTADDEIVLNYLYCFDMDKVVDRITMEQVLELVKTFFPDDYRRLGQGSLNQKQLLEQHRTHIIQKINGYGGYDDLDVSAIIEASQREHILKNTYG